MKLLIKIIISLSLYKLYIISLLGGIISTGKEATIFYGRGGKSAEVLVPRECALKVKNTLTYIKKKFIKNNLKIKGI